MKKTFGTVLLSVLLTVAVLALMGQGRDDWRYGGYINGKMAVRDSIRSQGPALFNSTTSTVGIATFSSQITLSGVGVGTVDSFSTTSATKAVALTGATLGDVFLVTPLTTTYSTAVDTNAAFYYTRYDSSGYVTVGRAALLGQALKSGAHFQVIKLNK